MSKERNYPTKRQLKKEIIQTQMLDKRKTEQYLEQHRSLVDPCIWSVDF